MADRKISDLTALTAPAAGDYLPIVDISDVSITNQNKRVTIQSLFQGIPTNVGIGTASPTATLHVRAADSNTAANVLRLEQFNATLTDSARLVVSIDPTNNAVSYDSTGFNTGGHVFLGGSIERMRLTPAGLLGIGTTTPGAALEVAGAPPEIRIRSTTSSDGFIRFVNTSGSMSVGMSGSADNIYQLTDRANSHVAYQYKGGASGFHFWSINGTERARIDSSGRLLVGTSTSRGTPASISAEARLQLEGSDNNTSAFSITNTLNGIAGRGPNIRTARIRGTGSVVLDDILGLWSSYGHDGSDFIEAATIRSQVDGTPGANDMPGRLVFSTTADGTASPTERLRITNDGVIAHDQPAPAAVNATATLTIANLKAGIITSTSAAATDMTLPTGTDTQAGFSGTYDNFTFEWSVINTGPSLVRVLAGTAHTIVGSGSVATGTSGRFASRRTAANTFVTYRLS